MKQEVSGSLSLCVLIWCGKIWNIDEMCAVLWISFISNTDKLSDSLVFRVSSHF